MKCTYQIIWVSLKLSLLLSSSNLCAEPGWMFLPGADYVIEPLQGIETFGETQSQGDASVVSSADEVTTEIAALARGLRYDPVAIFNFVRNEIDHYPYYGLTKGAALCLLERSGNDFDQCALLAALLYESGYEPTYHYGTMMIPLNSPDGMDMMSWLGATSSDGVRNYLWLMGNPGYEAAGSKFNPHRVWIEVQVAGQNTPDESSDDVIAVFDPAFKCYDTIPALADVLAEAGYDLNEYLSDAAGDSTLTGVNSDYYTENLNEAALYSRLTDETMGLLTNLSNSYPNVSVQELIGGRRVIREEIQDLDDIPTACSFPVTRMQSWGFGGTPATFATTISFSIPDRLDVTLYTADLQGKRLSLTLDPTISSNQLKATLWLDDEQIGVESSAIGSSATLTTSIDFPSPAYSGTDANDGGRSYVRGSNYALFYGFNPKRASLNSRLQRLDRYRAAGLGDTSREILTETLNLVGQQWLYQAELVGQLINAQEPDVLWQNNFFIGRVGQEEGPFIDIPLVSLSYVTRSGSFAVDPSIKFTKAFFWSAMEHGVLEQTQGRDLAPVSTIKLLELANNNWDQAGGRIFYVDSSNFEVNDNIRSRLTGYSLSRLNKFSSLLDEDEDSFLLIPQNGNITVGDWAGYGYVMGFRGDGIAMTINGDLGGHSTTAADYTNTDFMYFEWGHLTAGYLLKNPYSTDPVDMQTGAFVLESSDLSLGAGVAPRGITFSRSYSSQRFRDDSPGLGFGWTHNWNAEMVEMTALDAALGQTTVAEAVPMLLATSIVRNLIANQPPRTAKHHVLAALVAGWSVDHLVDNAAAVTIGKETIQYIRMPDGTFIAPAGVKSILFEWPDVIYGVSGDFALAEPFGNIYNFDGQNDYRLEWISDQHSSRLDIYYTLDGRVSTVQDEYGRRLVFDYVENRLHRVSHDYGGSLTFGYDESGNLTSVTDAENDVVRYHYHDTNTGSSYAANHLIVAVENGEGDITIRNFYDDQFRVICQHGDDDPSREYNLYFNGRENIEENPLGGQTRYLLDAVGRHIGTANELEEWTLREYDGQNNVVLVTTPSGATIASNYDSNNNLTSQELPGNLKRSFVYDSLDRLIEEHIQDLTLDSQDRVNTYSYDADNNTNLPDSASNAVGNVTRFTYFANGLIHTETAVCASGDRVVTYSYDSYGMPQEIHYPDGASEQFDFNTRGDLVSRTDREGNVTSYQYNDRRQVIQITNPDGGVTVNVYDRNGRLASVTDPRGSITRYSYSPQGMTLTVTTSDDTAEEAVNTLEYDLHNRRVREISPIGTVTEYDLDMAGRAVGVVDDLGRRMEYEYNADGSRIAATTPLGIRTTYGYGMRNLRTSLTDAASESVL